MATYYFRNAGTDWGTAANWSLTSGGGATGAVPTNADNAIFDASSTNCTVNASNRVCKTINFSAYTNTITMSNNITVSGSITFGASMNVSGSGTMIINATGTITSNGYVWPNAFSFGGTNQTYTLASTTRFSGTTTFLTGITTLNSNTLEVATLTMTGSVNGTSNLRMYTTGTWSGGGIVFNNLTFNSAGIITLSGTVLKQNNTLTYTAGTLSLTGSTLRIFGTTVSMLGFVGTTFNNLQIGTGGTGIATNLTIDGGFNVADTLILTATTSNSTCTITGTYNINTNSLTVSAGVVTSSTIIFNGSSGIWTQSGGFHNCPIEINGNVTLSTNINYGVNGGTNIFKYTSGTFTPSTFSLSVIAGCQLDLNGISFYDVAIGSNGVFAQTVTLLSNLTLTNNLTLGGGSTAFVINSNNINVAGSLSVTSATNYTGTANIVLNGTGTWSHSTQPASFTIPVIINTAGTITLSGSITKNGNLTFTTGTIVSTSSTLTWSGIMTVNASGFNLGTLSLTATSYFLGTNGFTIHTLNNTTAGIHSIWKDGNEYIITNNFVSGQVDAINRITYTSSLNRVFTGSISGSVLTVSAVTYGSGNITVGDEIFATGLTQGFTITSLGTGTGGTGTYNLSGSPGTLTSRTIISTPGTASYPKITLQNGAYQNLYYSNALDIDSLSGQTIWTFDSNLKRAFNWKLGTQPAQRSYAWVS